jgi:hypothetical protein
VAAVAVAIVVVFAAFFVPTLLKGRFFILHDSWCWSYPLRSAAWAQVHHGHLPFWTPGIFSGYPLLSMSQLGFGYPFTWLYAVSPAWGEQVYVLGPFLLCPLFTYLFARELGRSTPASLLAGFGFTYGGFVASPITHNGMLSNGYLWLPLVLLFVERSRNGDFLRCVLGGGVSFALSVLSGIGQAFLGVGILSLAYGTFLASSAPAEAPARQRLRPLAAALASITLGAGVGAFQILETAHANRLSVRRHLSYAIFTQGSATVHDVFASVLLPLHRQIGDVTSFVAPVVLLAAVIAVVADFGRATARNPAVRFWFGVVVVAFVLMFGSSTPLYRIAYYIPLLNLFRIPPRHAAEWTFAAAILGAYGWDAACAWVGARGLAARRWSRTWGGGLMLAIVGLVVWRWCQLGASDSWGKYAAYKSVATIALFCTAGYVLLLRDRAARGLLSLGIVVLGTVPESYLCLSSWWVPSAKSRAELERVGPVTAYVAQFHPSEYRVYTHINPFGEEPITDRPADAPNMTAIRGLAEVAGYDPMIFERYSQALGDVGMFAMPMGWNVPPDSDYSGPFNLRSHVLDILNARYVVRRLMPKEPVIPPDWEQLEVLDQLVLDVGRPEARHALKSGFREDDVLNGHTGAWTDGNRAVIKAFIVPEAERFRFRIKAIAYGDAAPVDLVIYLNNRRIAHKQMPAEWKDISIGLPRYAVNEGWNEIALVSGAHRPLQLFVDAISLTPMERSQSTTP